TPAATPSPSAGQAPARPSSRPLHDALADLPGAAPLAAPITDGAVEILPVAFMRGGTVRAACICVVEAQDLAVAQAGMVLARLGEGGFVALAGDPSQSPIPASAGAARRPWPGGWRAGWTGQAERGRLDGAGWTG